MSNEWNWHVNSLQTRLNDLQSTIDSIKSCVERRPGLDAATRAIAALIEASGQSDYALQEFPMALSQILADPSIGSLLIGPQGEIVLYNATAENLLGREFMKDRMVASVQFSTDDRSRQLSNDELPWTKAISGVALPDVRLHVRRPESESWLNVSATPFTSTQGAVTGAVVFLIDTTEEVQLESSISTLCDTIQEQIAQVGDTQSQLRDLADRLSGTGVQRILGDSSGTATPAPHQPEDPNRKKSHPRRDAGASPTAARTVLPQPVALPRPTKKSAETTAAKAAPPPLPAARVEAETETAKVVDSRDSSVEAEEDSFAAIAEPAKPTALAAPADEVYEEAQEEVVRNQTESGSWSIVPQTGGERFGAESMELTPIDIVDAKKSLEMEAIDALIADATNVVSSTALESEEVPNEFPSEEKIGDLPDTGSKQTSELMESSPAEKTKPARWSAEYSAYESGLKADPETAEESPKSDFWVSGQTPQAESQDAASSEPQGDDVGDSAKSLFGKFANLTKDSYGDARTEESKEPDPALPWPELVDGQDYGEPLWDEYTQSDEETTPWQQEKADEPTEEVAAPHMVAQESSAENQEDVDFSGLDVESVGQAYVAPASEVSEENGEGDGYAEAVASPSPEDDEFQPLSSGTEIKPVVVDQSPAEVQSTLDGDYMGEDAPLVATDDSVTDSSTSLPKADEDDIHNFSKPSPLKGKPRPSASYNKLRPLSAAAELKGSFLTEDLADQPEQVVRFSSQNSNAEEEGPQRVLVVDDIPVNQKLLLLHLKRLGYQADVASNGQEALDMLEDKSYQLVLMDCDMPVMSGFEAASRIRGNEAYSIGHRIPIIALTSYDREGDKEKCMAAGMDDYITKGASQKELKEAIERAFVSARLKTPESDEELDEADLAPPDITTMLKMYGKEEVEEISRLFLSSMGNYIDAMQIAIDNKDAAQVSHFATAVKGPCAALGMRLMTRLTTDIMAYADNQDWTQVRVKYMRLKAVFVQTREELKKVCPDDSLLAT